MRTIKSANRVRQSRGEKAARGAGFVLAFAVLSMMFFQDTASAVSYSYSSLTISCCSRTRTFATLIAGDYSQDAAAQNTAWTSFKSTFPGLVDSDRKGNRTFRYNCHAYVLYGSTKWLASPGVPANETGYFDDTATSCWYQSSSGTIKHNSTHSALVASNKGKCGAEFLCLNNQYVYGPLFPTTKYKKRT